MKGLPILPLALIGVGAFLLMNRDSKGSTPSQPQPSPQPQPQGGGGYVAKDVQGENGITFVGPSKEDQNPEPERNRSPSGQGVSLQTWPTSEPVENGGGGETNN